MGEMGAGYPLFFEFLKYCTYLMLLLVVIFVLPASAILAREYQTLLEANNGYGKNEDPLALFSVGAILNERIWERAKTPEGMEAFRDKKGALYNMFLCSMFALFGALLFLIYMRAKLIGKASLLDQDAFTPSDFCMQGYNMQFEDYTATGMEKEIRDFLEKKHNVTGV
jgi:hypothetical protein